VASIKEVTPFVILLGALLLLASLPERISNLSPHDQVVDMLIVLTAEWITSMEH